MCLRSFKLSMITLKKQKRYLQVDSDLDEINLYFFKYNNF